MPSFQLFTLVLTLIHSINAIVEAAATIIDASAASMMLDDGCRLAATDVTLFLSLASHFENEIMRQSGEIVPAIYDGES